MSDHIPGFASGRTLLIIDDDVRFAERLGKAMERRGYDVTVAHSVEDGKRKGLAAPPAYSVVDLRLQDGSGLEVVEAITKVSPSTRIIVLTSYGNIATAVSAVKLGATDYLPKPADPDVIEEALTANDRLLLPPPPEFPMTADRVRWEHILRIYEQCDRNVSETARRLRMHRRTLQRILNKHAPRS